MVNCFTCETEIESVCAAGIPIIMQVNTLEEVQEAVEMGAAAIIAQVRSTRRWLNHLLIYTLMQNLASNVEFRKQLRAQCVAKFVLLGQNLNSSQGLEFKAAVA